ncbi:MAG: SusC/RagA family TonB-linked outer membrane protein [Bacteroidetes bacterium]|nr:SusC/RagA family TonB-linked outer membrane protein [Bacteroidota bacterium]MBS1757997.1 SusC/RagA family TonB-linked outer membrane protein [Bacteroidota bacterium]
MRLLMVAFISMCSLIAFAQGKKSVSGTVADNSGNPLTGVTIKVKGAKTSVVSDAQGNFTIAIPGSTATLQISSVGYTPTDVRVTAGSPVTVSLKQNTEQLNEVIVTALGIKKEKKSIGYTAQDVKGESLVQAREPNLTNALTGKVAGLQIARSGNGLGGSSQILLRGNNSLSGLSQPLIVVDGVPMDNSTGRVGIGATNDFWNPSLDMGNGLSDINADDIASITVLKGPAAASLYGSLGGNGVILITTKTGKKQPGLGFSVSSSVGFEKVFTRADMQNQFGQGSTGIYDSSAGTSWGPKITGQLVNDWSGKNTPLRAYDNAANFFNTGIVSNQEISFQQQYKSTSIYTSYNRFDAKSMVPGSKLIRNNITARAVTKFGNNENWTLDSKIQFINAEADNRSLVGQNSGMFASIYNLPVTLDLTQFSAATDNLGKMIWYNKSGTNPYWSTKYNQNSDIRNRFFLYGSLKHNFTSWLKGEINAGADMYTTNTESKVYTGSLSNNSYGLGKQTYQQTNYSAMFTASKDNLIGKLGGALMVGGNLMSYQNSALNASTSKLNVPNLFSINNSVGMPDFGQSFSQKKINSLYGSVDVNFDQYLFLNATFRNDWSSALSKANQSYFYPSVSLSYVFTDMFRKTGINMPSWLSYGKLRGTYAMAGSDLDPYQLYNTYFIGNDPNGNTTAYSNSTLYDSTVRSQLMKSIEGGLEMRFLHNRIGFDLSIYKTNSTRQLINLPLDPLSGYSSKKINAGDVQNSGVELVIDGQVLSNPKGLNWTVGFNYSHNNNVVKSIYPNVPRYGLGGFDNIQILAVEGQKYGEIYGSQIYRVSSPTDPSYGKWILKNGLPQPTPGAPVRLGNQQANALLGFTNTFSYKGFGLSFQIDARIGGKIFSGTAFSMERSGTAGWTVANGRDSLIVPGVVFDAGQNKYVPNTTKISTQQYWVSGLAGSGNLGITEANLYDASNVRLRNIQLSYTLPKSVLQRSFVQKAIVSVSCNNVWLISSHMHGIDPESSYATGTPAVGFENGAAPTSRIFYVNLALGF